MKKIIVLSAVTLLGMISILVYGLWYKTTDAEIIFTQSAASSPSEVSERWPFDDFWKQSFLVACKLKRLNEIPAGKYKISSDLSPIDVVHILRRKEQVDILLRIDIAPNADSLFQVFSNELGHTVGEYESAFDSIFQANDSPINPLIRTTYFFADTYAFTYGESPKKTANRFHQYHQEFWNEERMAKQKKLGLTQEEIYILASMVKGETKVFEEAPIIAGLYINRLNKPMKLQCDATVKYALSLKKAQRILKEDLNQESPFNTYNVDGLPPGPIFITEKKYLDAVLEYKSHPYLYMCAEDNGSGKHLFTASFNEHQRNAQRYQRYLNGLNIKR
ncbi:MAG: hypothetical protein RLY35_93 [Bacteroidota bacterium]|jgi:UPF0755 protein